MKVPPKLRRIAIGVVVGDEQVAFKMVIKVSLTRADRLSATNSALSSLSVNDLAGSQGTFVITWETETYPANGIVVGRLDGVNVGELEGDIEGTELGEYVAGRQIDTDVIVTSTAVGTGTTLE